MPLYRVRVKSSDRVSGFPGSFTYQLNDVFRNATGICKVLLESVSQIRFSPDSNDYTLYSTANAGSLLLNLGGGIPSQNCSVDTWTGSQSRSITQLQSWNNSGIYGRSSGPNHVSKYAQGSVFDAKILHRVRLLEPYLEFFSQKDGRVRRVTTSDNIEDWSMVLLFYTAEGKVPRSIFTPYVRIVVSSADRMSGTVADCLVPFRVDAPTLASGPKWNLLAEHASTIHHDTANQNAGLTLRCDFVSNSDSQTDNAVHSFGRSYWSLEDRFLGISLITNSQLTSMDFGHPVHGDIRNITRWRLSLVDTVTGAAPNDPELLSEYLVSFVLFQSFSD